MKKYSPIVGLTLVLTACATAPGHRVPSAPRADQRTLIVDNATAMLGQPYRFGGASPGGFDCSGLVVYATGGAGIELPRTAREQMNAGAPVRRGELQAGDLVFMHLARKELHVGIAIGNERFVHAPSAGGYVRVDSLGATPYARAFVGARRVVDSAESRRASRAGATAIHYGDGFVPAD